MIKKIDRNAARKVRHKRVRKKIFGTAERPRLNVFRSLNHIYVQIIDDEKVIPWYQLPALTRKSGMFPTRQRRKLPEW